MAGSDPVRPRPSRARVDTWLLPGELAASLSPGAPQRRRNPRTPRDWVVDSVLFAAAALAWFSELVTGSPVFDIPDWLFRLDIAAGAVMCLALWWRRDFPVAVGLLAAVTGAFSNSAGIALLIGLFSLALHRGWRWGFGVAALAQALALPYLLTYYPDGVGGPTSWAVIVTLLVLLVTTAGLAVRARRALVLVLGERAEEARREQVRAAERVRLAERSRIAREMHDVLAHRLSLLAVHSGALEYRVGRSGEPLPAAQLVESVGVIREGAHLALEELRETLQILRSTDLTGGMPGLDPSASDPEGTAPPAPTLATLPDLVAEAQAAGQRVELVVDVPGAGELPSSVQRTAYRVVQEGLTNARKHAPGAGVAVRAARTGVGAAPGGVAQVLTVSVSNAVQPVLSSAELPGASSGLLGLAERVAAHGGALSHDVEDGHFVLAVTLPLAGAAQERGGGPG